MKHTHVETSCPRCRNAANCHRIRPETTPCASFFHVPVPISYASATDFSKGLLFFGPFVMSQLQKCGYLPQIPAGDYSLCKLFSCPGINILSFCHRFQQETSLLRPICHVPAAEMRLFATDSGRRLLLVQAFFMSRYQYPVVLPQICPESRLRTSLLHVKETETPSSAIKCRQKRIPKNSAPA